MKKSIFVLLYGLLHIGLLLWFVVPRYYQASGIESYRCEASLGSSQTYPCTLAEYVFDDLGLFIIFALLFQSILIPSMLATYVLYKRIPKLHNTIITKPIWMQYVLVVSICCLIVLTMLQI